MKRDELANAYANTDPVIDIEVAFCKGWDAREYHDYFQDTIEIKKLTARISALEEALKSMHIDDCAYGMNLEYVDFETAIGWHKANNQKIEQALEQREEG